MLSKLCIASASGTNRQDIATVPPHKKRTKKRGECGKNKKKEREREGKGRGNAAAHTYNISISGLDFGFSFPQYYMEILYRQGRQGEGENDTKRLKKATTHSAATCHH